MEAPKISIIIPVYNVEKYLGKCVQSAINQTLRNIEIILVDDESPDGCPSICDEYAKADIRIKVVHRKNGGLGFARNSGIEVATGEYITFLDSDDFVDLDTYNHLYDLAKRHNLDTIYYKFKRFTNESDVTKSIPVYDLTEYKGEEVKNLMLDIIASEPSEKVDHKIQCSSCTAMYRMDIIKRNNVRFHSERELISEDLIFNLDFLKYANAVAFNKGEHYHYRMNPTSLTSVVRKDRIEKNYILYEYIKENIANWGLNQQDGNERNARLFIGNSRSSITHYIQSNAIFNEKRRWLKEECKRHIWKDLNTNYNWEKLPTYQRVFFKLCAQKRTFSLFLLCKIKNILNRR